MSNAPQISFMPRVWSDIAECMDFLARQPWGMPLRREFEIHAAFERIRAEPFAHPVSGYVPGSGIALRCCPVRQFDVIYAYFSPEQAPPHGLVSIRAVRHRRTQHVLRGVTECADVARFPGPLRTSDADVEEAEV